jgi:nitroimidazol reductase NimA-like FMN-containing flavoprotein (pyridoxamine 5'-phosphate oxidase superfamily)
MTRPKDESDRPLVLDPTEIDEILSKRLIANFATLDNDGGIHLLPMWFLRMNNDICIPTSSKTHKYRNLKVRPCASVMIDVSREGLNLKGVLIRVRFSLFMEKLAGLIIRFI